MKEIKVREVQSEYLEDAICRLRALSELLANKKLYCTTPLDEEIINYGISITLQDSVRAIVICQESLRKKERSS